MDLSLEPWMRGYHVGVDPVIAAVLYSLQQIREDAQNWTHDLTQEQLWHAEGDVAPAGFHLRHLAGSIDRLITYADGKSLTDEQLATLGAEKQRDLTTAQLLAMLEASIVKAEAILRTTSPSDFGERRTIGRKEIPTTLAGLLIHTAEHSQRHLGAMITAIKLARHRHSA